MKGRQLFKKSLAGLLAMVMVLSIFLTYAPALESLATGLVPEDGGFESDTWNTENASKVVYSRVSKAEDPTNVHSGDFAAKLTYDAGSTAQSYLGLTNAAFDLEPDTIYELSYWVKGAGFAECNNYIGVRDANNSSKWYGGKKNLSYFSNPTTEWTQTKVNFTTDSEADKAIICLNVGWVVTKDLSAFADGIAMYLDDIVLTEIGKSALNGELAKVDGTVVKKWNATPTGLKGTVQTEVAKDGDALKIESVEGKVGTSFELVSEDVTVTANQDYYVSYFVKTPDFPGLNYGVTISDATTGAVLGSNIGVGKTGPGFGTDWVECEGKFTTKADTEKIKIKISAYTDATESLTHEAGAALYLDELVIKKVPDSAKNDGTLDGGFEKVYKKEVMNWKSNNNNKNLTISASTDAHSGDYSLKFTSVSGAKGNQLVGSNKVEVEPNTTYELSYFVKSEDMVGAQSYIIVHDAANADMSQFITTKKDTANFVASADKEGEWVYCKESFTTKADTNALILEINVGNWNAESLKAGSALYIDDLSLEKYSNDLDGGFENTFGVEVLKSWTSLYNKANAVVAKPTTNAHSGEYALEFENASKEEGYQELLSKTVPVEPNTTYNVSYYVKNVDFAGAVGYVAAYDAKTKQWEGMSPKKDLGYFSMTESSHKDWTLMTGQFTTGPETTEVYFTFVVNTYSIETQKLGASLYIDDFVVEKDVPETTLIKNPDFEKIGLLSWRAAIHPQNADGKVDATIPNNMTAMKVPGGQSGESSLYIQADVKGYVVVLQDKAFPVEPNSTYRFVYYVKTSNADTAKVDAAIRAYKQDGKTSTIGDYTRTTAAPGNQGEWKRIVTYYNTAADQYYMNVELTVSLTANMKKGKVAQAWFDNLSLEKVPSIGEKDNLGFEYIEEDSLYDWSFRYSANSGEDVLKLRGDDYSWKMETKKVHEGKKALKVTTASTVGHALVSSRLLSVKGGATYKVSYWVNLSGAKSSSIGIGFHMTKQDGTPASTEWLWAHDNDVKGPTEGWQLITTYLTVSDDTKYADIRFVINGSKTTALIDDVSFEKYNIDENLNLGFEDGDHNWQLGSGTITFDNKVYHGGKASIHVKKSSQSDTKITSMSHTKVKEGDTYLFGGWYKSKDNINAKIRINLNCYDKDGNMYRTDGSRRIILGPEVNGNTDEKASGWQRLMLYGNIPTDTVSVGLEIIVGDGRAEVWFDDLFFRKANYTESARLVDYTMMDEIDNKGNLQSVTLQEVEGSATFKANDGKVKLQVEQESEAYIAYETDYLTPNESFDITLHNYMADKPAKLLVQYYDYKGNHLETYDVSEEVPASKEWADHTMQVTVPSSMYAKVCFGSAEAGTYTLSQIDIVKVEVEDASSTWAGRWIWFNEDAWQTGQYATRYYRHKFNLDGKATDAPFQITVDDWYVLYVNGQKISDESDEGINNWAVPHTYDLVPYLKEGENIIALETYNQVNVGGLLYDCRVTLEGKEDERVMVVSDPAVVVSSNSKPSKGWQEYSYNDSKWIPVKDMGKVGVGPWGVIAFDGSLYADDKIKIVSFETQEEAAHTGSVALIDAVIEIEKELKYDHPFEVNVYKKNTTSQITSAMLEIKEGGQPSEWKVGKNKVTFAMSIPDYLSTGNYSLQMSDQHYYLTNEGLIDNKFADIMVLAANEEQELHRAEVKNVNGTPTFFVDGEAKSSVLYQDPGSEIWWDMQNEGDVMEQSGVELYVSNRLALWDYMDRTKNLWLDENTIDYAYIDKVVYDVLSADPDALIMQTFDLQAPTWWLDQNPDEEQLHYYSETDTFGPPSDHRYASWSSQKWLTDVSDVLDKIIKHMMDSDYASHIIGIRISAGKGPEYLTHDTGGTITNDYSKASLKRFREWLKDTYKTNKALQKAWNDPTITFNKVTVPEWEDRIKPWLSTDGVSDTIIMDPAKNRWVIDYNYFTTYEATNTFVKCCEQIKESSEGYWLAGGYHGYAWHQAGTSGTTSSHEAMELVLNSDAVDFIASPYIYGERKKGEDSAMYAMIDGIQAAGKMFIMEVDTRSVYEGTSNADTDASVGVCYTMRESIDALKKDMSQNIARGVGFWIYNMYGTWWYDEQMMNVYRDVKEEYDYSTEMGSTTVSDVAVFVGEMNYAYLSNAETYSANRTYNYLYQFQRRNLATMGTEFDLYYVEDLLQERVKKDYKINIMLSPYELTAEERQVIEKELKRDGKIIVWVNLAGISNGRANSMQLIQELTGFNVEYIQTKGALTGYFVDGHELTEGIEGFTYGDDASGATNGVGPLLYVDASKDKGIVELAKCMFDESKSALVMKDMGDWISIYSGPACLPNGFLRNLVEYAGGHIYTDNESDIVHVSEQYLTIYSLYGGKRTVTLPKNCSVYDVFEKEYVSLNTDTFKVDMADNESKIYRLMSPDKVSVLAITKGAHATLDKYGITELTPGEDYEVNVKVDDGYKLKSVKVNGEEVDVTETVKLSDVDDSTRIVFETELVKTYGVFTSSLAVRWTLIGLLVVGGVLAITVGGVGIEVVIEKLKRNRRKR